MVLTERYPDDIHPQFSVATVYGPDGLPYDYVDHNEPARSYAARGYRVVVHRGHGPYTREELQEVVDLEFADSSSTATAAGRTA